MLENMEGSSRSKRVGDLVQDRVGIEVQFGKRAYIAYDFTKFLSFHKEQHINVGIKIMATCSLARGMSAGVGNWEGAMQLLNNRPRGHPPMPLVLAGIGLPDEK